MTEEQEQPRVGDPDEPIPAPSTIDSSLIPFVDTTFAGKILVTHHVKGNDVIHFEKDTNTPAIFIASNGTNIVPFERKGGWSSTETIIPEEFQIVGFGNTIEEALKDFAKKEDRILMKLLVHAMVAHNDPVLLKTDLSDTDQGVGTIKGDLEDVQLLVEKWRLIADKFLMSPHFFDRIEKLEERDAGENPVEGTYGHVWGVMLGELPIDLMPVPMIIALSEGRYLGARSIRTVTDVSKVVVGPNNEPCAVLCQEAMTILNTRAIGCGLTKSFIRMRADLDKILLGMTLSDHIKKEKVDSLDNEMSIDEKVKKIAKISKDIKAHLDKIEVLQEDMQRIL
jgi:hypothetical protein